VKYLWVVLIGGVVLTVRLVLYRRRSRHREDAAGFARRDGAAPDETPGTPVSELRRPRFRGFGAALGDVGLVAGREIRERVRSRIFRVGTVIIVLGVAAAIVIPAIHKSGSSPQRVGVVGAASPELDKVVASVEKLNGTTARIVAVASVPAAEAGLRSGSLDLVIVDGDHILVDDASTTTDTTVQTLAQELGVLQAYRHVGLSDTQIAQVARPAPVPVRSLQAGSARPKGAVKGTSVIGIVLLFFMLTQYNTWILIGVMQEKASRVVEVLLATVRPIQLLGGKVLGIGLVAMGQAALLLAVALVLGSAVGSDVLRGTGTLVLVSLLVWLVLGYAFYCWVYAGVGSMAERQDQVQTLALPLSLPILLGYILAITAASSGQVSAFFRVLAYLPPTAPFAMPVLVGLHQVAWWQFMLSVLISLAGTALMARLAAEVYRRAVLQSGRRVSLRELRTRRARPAPAG
jgi:ABC-2 type transport system permease protein